LQQEENAATRRKDTAGNEKMPFLTLTVTLPRHFDSRLFHEL